MTLALCTSADFCQHSQQISPASGDSKENNPVPENSVEMSSVSPIWDEVTPVPSDLKDDKSNSRIPRTWLAGTRPPVNLDFVESPAGREQDFVVQFPAGPVEDGDNLLVSYKLRAF